MSRNRLASTSLAIVACLGVLLSDFLALLANWGPCP